MTIAPYSRQVSGPIQRCQLPGPAETLKYIAEERAVAKITCLAFDDSPTGRLWLIEIGGLADGPSGKAWYSIKKSDFVWHATRAIEQFNKAAQWAADVTAERVQSLVDARFAEEPLEARHA